MRPIALFFAAALLVTLELSVTARELPSPVAIEQTALRTDEVESRQRHKLEKPSSRTVKESKSNTFTLSTEGSDFKFKFNGGFDGRGFNFKMEPPPREVLRKLWLSPLELLSRGRFLVLWMAMSLGIAALFQPQLRRAQQELMKAPAKSVAIGVVWNIAFWALLAASALLCLILIGVPLLISLVIFHLVLGVFGMTLTFSVLGEWIARRINQSAVSIYVAILVGATFLGLLRMLPLFGSLIWFVAGLFGTGAALAARFGIVPAPAARPELPA
jgi:hypothetical protein